MRAALNLARSCVGWYSAGMAKRSVRVKELSKVEQIGMLLGLFRLVGYVGKCALETLDGKNRPYVLQAEFSSLAACLRSVPRDARSPIKETLRDSPEMVQGVLANGQNFFCQRKVTGTKGTYYLGWYTVPGKG